MHPNTLLNNSPTTLSDSLNDRIINRSRRRSSSLTGSVGPNDVMCGRRAEAFNNSGNIKFRALVEKQLDRYTNPNATRKEKTGIVRFIVSHVKSNGGRFIKWHEKEQSWQVLSEGQARAKAGHCIRDMAAARDATLKQKTGRAADISKAPPPCSHPAGGDESQETREGVASDSEMSGDDIYPLSEDYEMDIYNDADFELFCFSMLE